MMEKRTHKVTFELNDDNNTLKLRGHAAVFNTVADGGWYREQISPGAFSSSLKQDDIRALWNHDTNIVLGRNVAGTLELREDKKGLAVEITPPQTSMVRDLLESVRRGDVSQMSFGFEVLKQTWVEEEGELDLRTINEVKLWEVSPVTFPFYQDTDIALIKTPSPKSVTVRKRIVQI